MHCLPVVVWRSSVFAQRVECGEATSYAKLVTRQTQGPKSYPAKAKGVLPSKFRRRKVPPFAAITCAEGPQINV